MGARDWWMTMEKLKLCVCWSACGGSPRSISLACFKQEEQTKLMTDLCQHVKTRSWTLERRDREIDEGRWRNWSFAFAGQSAVDRPEAFPWHASSKKNRPSWCVFALRTAWIADILSQAPLRDVQRQRRLNLSSRDGQKLWDYGMTERFFNAVSALCVAIERRDLTLTWTACKIGGSLKRNAANLYDVLISRQRWIVEEDLMLSPIIDHT